MAAQWIGDIVVGAVAITGMASTLYMAAKGRRQAETLAATARRQDRRAEAYVQALSVAEHLGNWAQRARPALDSVPPQPSPSIPDLDSQIASRARLLAFGSPEVTHIWDEWFGQIRALERAVYQLDLSEEPGSGIDRWRLIHGGSVDDGP